MAAGERKASEIVGFEEFADFKRVLAEFLLIFTKLVGKRRYLIVLCAP